MQKSTTGSKPLKESLQEYARGITGGLLFSFPILYTMEVWWSGYMAQSYHLIAIMVVTFLLLLGYNRYAGMRPGTSWRDITIDSFEEMGIGILISFGALLMLNRISFTDMSISEIMGKVVIEAMAVSIGVSVGTAQLSAGEEEELEEQHDEERAEGAKGEMVNSSNRKAMAVLALCGSILIGGNIAPTEEVLVLALAAERGHILAMALISLFLSMLVVYFSNFKGTNRHKNGNLLYEVVYDTCTSYLLALTASAFTLWYFGRFDGLSFWNILAQCIVLGVVASLGASAGRLLIK